MIRQIGSGPSSTNKLSKAKQVTLNAISATKKADCLGVAGDRQQNNKMNNFAGMLVDEDEGQPIAEEDVMENARVTYDIFI